MARLFPLITLIILLLCTTALGAMFGSPEPERGAGKASVGLAYGTDSKNSGNFTQEQIAGIFSYSVSDDWSMFFRGAAEKFKADNLIGVGESEGETVSLGLGIKGLFYRGPSFSAGVFLSGSYLLPFEDKTNVFVASSGLSYEVKYSFDNFYEINTGLLLQTVVDGGLLYGGPFYRRSEGDLTVGFDPSPLVTTAGSYFGGTLKFEEKDQFGGIVGIRWPIKNGMNVDFEIVSIDAVVGSLAVHFPVDF